MSGAPSALLEVAMPEFEGKRDWYDLLAGDLVREGLSDNNLHTMMTGPSMSASSTTPLGQRFLAFVS